MPIVEVRGHRRAARSCDYFSMSRSLHKPQRHPMHVPDTVLVSVVREQIHLKLIDFQASFATVPPYFMDLRLSDKTAIVSGSTKGIGFAVATGLAHEGARVIVNGRSEKAVAEAKQQIVQAQPDAKVESFAGDLSTAAATATLLQR